MKHRAYNPTLAPVVIDAAGHSLAGGEWGEVDDTDDVGKAALSAGQLHVPEDETSGEPEPATTTTANQPKSVRRGAAPKE